MRDARLRELERRWRASAAIEDEVAYVQARLRAGELTADRLRWAAELGDPVATRLGPPASLAAVDVVAEAFGQGVAALDPAEQRRFACDCAERVLAVWERERPADGAPAAAIRVARRLAAGEADLDALRVARQGADAAAREAAEALGSDHPVVFAVRSAWAAASDPEREDYAALAASQAALTAGLPSEPGNPVYDWQRELLASALLRRGVAGTPLDDEERLPVYSPRFAFSVGQRLRHPKFGVGEVRFADARRIDVAFGDGEVRRLAQGR